VQEAADSGRLVTEQESGAGMEAGSKRGEAASSQHPAMQTGVDRQSAHNKRFSSGQARRSERDMLDERTQHEVRIQSCMIESKPNTIETSGPGKNLKLSSTHRHHNQWLILIGSLKLLKAILFFLIGVGALRLLHKDLVDVLTRAAVDMRFDPESHFVNMLLEKVSLLNDHRLKQISMAVFCYAGLDIAEGIGLILEKAWAEYLTLILTASFLPWELFEIFRHVTGFKIALILLNLLVLIYLVFHVQSRARERQRYQNSSRQEEQE
jgi:uncharacterized membrane protein (DUF2068 family)